MVVGDRRRAVGAAGRGSIGLLMTDVVWGHSSTTLENYPNFAFYRISSTVFQLRFVRQLTKGKERVSSLKRSFYSIFDKTHVEIANASRLLGYSFQPKSPKVEIGGMKHRTLEAENISLCYMILISYQTSTRHEQG